MGDGVSPMGEGGRVIKLAFDSLWSQECIQF